MAVKPLPCKRDASLECEWPNCKCYPALESVRSEALTWYEDQCAALSKYTIAKQTDAMMACVTALSLDAGARARAALQSPARVAEGERSDHDVVGEHLRSTELRK